jgi:2-haloacid dehalogenase
MAHPRFGDISVCVFDAYGTLFDYNTAAGRHSATLGEKAAPLADLWRLKQLQYTWLRSLMGRYTGFWQVTGEALDFAMGELGIEDEALRANLMEAYLTLDTYPEVQETLATLRAHGLRTAILSNGESSMLDAAVEAAGIADSLDAVLSVEEVGIYKPHPSVYQLVVDRLGVEAANVSFQSSNAWDANGAAAFGFRVAWCNRFGQGQERVPEAPDAEIVTLAELPALLGIA